jgi:hypothetical protein
MSLVPEARQKFGIVGELFSFFLTEKRWWMLPVVTVLLLLGAFMLLAQTSAIAPFLYTLF